MNEELKQLYEELKTIPYSEKPQWAKALENMNRTERKKRKKRQEFEILSGSLDYLSN